MTLRAVHPDENWDDSLWDMDLERFVLGAVAQHPPYLTDIIAVGVQRSDFMVPGHQALYAAMVALQDEGKTPDIVQVHHLLRGMEDYEGLGGWAYLYQAGMVMPPAIWCKEWAASLRDLGSKRRIAGVGPEITMIATTHRDVAEVVSRAEMALQKAAQAATSRLSGSPFAADIWAEARGITPWPTPWAPINNLAGGLEPGQVWTVMGTSTNGKTVVALNLAAPIMQAGGHVAYFNLDSDRRFILNRMASLVSGLHRDLFRHELTPDAAQYREVQAAKDAFISGEFRERFLIYAEREVHRILATARAHKVRYGLDLMVVDFIQHVNVEGAATLYERLEVMMPAFQEFAQAQGVVVMLLSQSSVAQQKEGVVDDSYNAKGYGGVKDASDVCLVSRFADPVQRPRDLTLFVLKSKEGSKGNVFMDFEPSCMRLDAKPAREQSKEYQEWLMREGR